MSCLWPSKVRNRRYDRHCGSFPLDRDDFLNGLIPPDYYVLIPCGTCPECRRAYKSQWTCRLLFEASHQPIGNCIFMSLTFSDEFIKRDDQGNPVGFSRSECARLFRRFRDNFRKKYGFSFRYFCVSELGGKTGRFHLHAIIWADGFRNKSIRYNDIKSLWKYGFSYIEPIRSYGAFNYITKYILKPPEFDPWYRPVVLCSPRIGYDAVRANKNYNKAFFASSSFFVLAGFTYRVPVYYRRKFLSDYEMMIRSWRIASSPPPLVYNYHGRSYRNLSDFEYARDLDREYIISNMPHFVPFRISQNLYKNAFNFRHFDSEAETF